MQSVNQKTAANSTTGVQASRYAEQTETKLKYKPANPVVSSLLAAPAHSESSACTLPQHCVGSKNNNAVAESLVSELNTDGVLYMYLLDVFDVTEAVPGLV